MLIFYSSLKRQRHAAYVVNPHFTDEEIGSKRFSDLSKVTQVKKGRIMN